ncbi:Hypothetical predicted protein [Scomber scombrus]|uniref:Uncharacterized protein n=1 Tax=Scomber scombrus TaxID=13677 RepID=A0AAV1MRY5_SCOSC
MALTDCAPKPPVPRYGALCAAPDGASGLQTPVKWRTVLLLLPIFLRVNPGARERILTVHPRPVGNQLVCRRQTGRGLQSRGLK